MKKITQDLKKMSFYSGPSEAVRHGGSRRTKNLQGERVRKGREGGKKEKRGEKERKERERRVREAKRKRCITPMGVKHPLGTVKYYKDTKRGRGVKKALRKAGRKEEETEKAGENMVT